MTWLIYGANGYTGRLVARLATERGHRPVLAGRHASRVGPLAAELGLEHRAFSLDDPRGLADGLEGVTAVAHCAGPFSATSRPMVEACLATGVHYLDITGEIDVLEDVLSRDEAARRAGVSLLAGSGFDVVPTDCLAAMLVARLPDATSLQIAFRAGGGPSPGTARTSLEGLAAGGRARVGGRITRVPAAWRRRTVAFPSGPRTVTSIPWGDVSTAYHSTGVGEVVTYTEVPYSRALPFVAPLVRPGVLRHGLQALVGLGVAGPDAGRRSRSRAEVWAEASDGRGGTVVGTLTTPNGYAFTADSLVRALERVLGGEVPSGALTPSRAHGAEFVLGLDGVTLHGIRAGAG